MKYNAFISYNKAADIQLAPAVRKALEQFAKPVFKRKALNIFLDSSSLAATPDLWDSIQKGLEGAEYCIFLASPGSSKSPWCIKELMFWKENKDINKLLLILTHGNLDWNDATNDFNWETTDAFPSELAGIFKNEPLYIDVREQYAKDQFTLSNPLFKNYIGMLAAPLHNVPLEDLIGEDIKMHKRTIRLRNGAIGVLTILLLSAVFLMMYAFKQESIAKQNQLEAEKQKKEAVHQSKRALLKSYLVDSKSNLKNDPTIALKLALFAYQFASKESVNTDEAKDQLIVAYNSGAEYYIKHENFNIPKDPVFAFTNMKSFEGKSLSIKKNGFLVLEDKSGSSIALPQFDTRIIDYSFTPGGKFIAVIPAVFLGGDYANAISKIFDLNGNEITYARNEGVSNPVVLADSSGNNILLCGSNVAILIDYNNGVPNVYKFETTDAFTSFDLSKDGQLVALGYSNGKIEITDRENNKTDLDGHNSEPIDAISFSDDGQYIFSKSKNLKRKWKTYASKPFYKYETKLTSLTTTDATDTIQLENKEGIILSKWKFLKDKDQTRTTTIVFQNLNGNTIATFSESKEYTEKITSKDNKYYATKNGLFNSRNELLIKLEYKENHWSNYMICGFSDDNKYFLADDKIYAIDPQSILARLKVKFGEIEPFSADEKESYLIFEEKSNLKK